MQHYDVDNLTLFSGQMRVHFSPWLTKILVVGLLLALEVQQTVPIPQFRHAHRAHWGLFGLAVLHQQVAHADAAPGHPR